MPYYPSTSSTTTTATAPALHRKSAPTCTLSLAHVSAAPFHTQSSSSIKIMNSEINLGTVQLDLRVDFSSVISVPVQVQVVSNNAEPAFLAHPPQQYYGSARRSKGKKRHSKRNDINYIPFPTTSASTPSSPSSDSSASSFNYSSSRPTYSSSSSRSSNSSQTSYTSSSSTSTAPHVLLRATNVSQAPQRQQPQRARKSTIQPNSPAPSSIPTLRSSLRPFASSQGSIAPSAPAHNPVIVSPLPQRIQALRGPALGSGVAIQRSTSAHNVYAQHQQHPERPSSPTPNVDEQQQLHHLSLASLTPMLQDKKQQLKKEKENEEIFDPPPYSSPPPPYSASPSRSPSPESTALKPAQPVNIRPLPPISVKPSRIPTPVASKPSPSPSSSSSSSKAHSQSYPRRQRIASSDLKVLVYLYRTVMYGVEKRYRAEMERAAVASRSTSPTPIASPYAAAAAVVDDNDDDNDCHLNANANASSKYHRGSGTHVAGASNASRFGRFPLVEEEEEDCAAKDDDHIFPSFALSSSERRQRVAELEVQDALLAIRLRGFLKMQGVPEAELDVQFDGEDAYGCGSGYSCRDEDGAEDEEDEDRRMMDEVEREISKIQLNQVSAPSPDVQAQAQVPDRPIRSSPPPLSPVPKVRQRRSVLPTSYMIAFLLMKHRMTSSSSSSSSPRRGFGGVGSSSGSGGNGYARRGSARGMRSGLRMCSWAAAEEAEGDEGEVIVQEMEEEYDPSSVVDWYAGMDY